MSERNGRDLRGWIMAAPGRVVRAGTDRLGIALLALLAFVPTLLSSPGKMPADTKLYLYLDPGRLTTDATWTIDPRQFAGWVPHQQSTYLWPSGPWYWFFETLGVPDWIAHRLWLGTLFLVGGLGMRWLAKHLGVAPAGALCAAVVYQLSPYVLPYVSRTSLMLLPWAGLGWIVALTIRAATRSSWRDVGILALVIATVGSPNATALAMVAPAPVLWLVHAAWSRLVTWRRALITGAKIGVMAIGVSLWWISMLAVQGRNGAEVLGYSESLEAVSVASTSSEVLRGLGYWLFYLRDAYAPTTSAAEDYLVNVPLIVAGYLLLVVCLAGLVLTRWRHRRFAIWCFAVGSLLAVGVHRLHDPAPVTEWLVRDTESGLALALRSSTRALPVAVLGLALGAGALVTAVRPRRSWVRTAVPIAIAALAILNMPSLWRRDYVDPALEREQDPPPAWLEASAALDESGAGGRVLQLPGQEFGAFRWGYTVDPPLPGLTEKPLVTRDLLPLGSPSAMDLLFAFDDRFQERIVEPQTIAPIARLLGSDVVWVTNDAAFDRFRTPRPERITGLFGAQPEGLGEPVPYGEPAINVPDVDMIDEASVSDERIGTPVPPVMLVPVEDPVPVIRAKERTVLIAGSGDGVVDAAAAGLIDGTELVRYAADVQVGGNGALRRTINRTGAVVITDSNRDRAHRWGSSQDAVGFTESGEPGNDLLRGESADARLPVFPGAGSANQTIAVQDGPVTAIASAYGEPFAYRPEHRAVMAIDGDPTTAWVVGDRFAADGERIVLTIDRGIDHITMLQPRFARRQRHVTAVDVRIDDGDVQRVDLDETSYRRPGQRVEIDPTDGPTRVEITIAATESPVDVPGPRLAAVGFAELDVGLRPTVEVVRPPTEVLGQLDAVGAETPVSLVFTRLRHDPQDRFRADPEPGLERRFPLAADLEAEPAITVRIDPRAGDELLSEVLDIDGPIASDRLAGTPTAAGFWVADGDPATAWISPFAYPGDHVLRIPIEPGETLDELTITQPTDAGRFSTITTLRVGAGDASWDVEVPPPDEDGASTIALPEPISDADELTLTVTAFDGVVVTDRRYAEPVFLPVAISEVSAATPVTVPESVELPCRDDLLSLDGEPIAVSLSGEVDALLAGEPFETTVCETTTTSTTATRTLEAGSHRLSASARRQTGLQVDRVVLTGQTATSATSAIGAGTTVSEPTSAWQDGDGLVPTEVVSRTRTSARVTVGPCPDGCWFVFGEGFNDAWTATMEPAATDDRDDTPDPGAPTERATTKLLGAPVPVDGGFNGWYIPPTRRKMSVTVEWTAQGPATYGLLLSGGFVVLAAALVLVDRRRRPAQDLASVEDRPEVAGIRSAEPRLHAAIAGAAGVAAAAVFIRPAWALPVLAVAALVIALRRSRLAGVAGLALAVAIGASTVYSVTVDDPFPNGLWLQTVEHLHLVGLLAIVLVFMSSVLPDDAAPPDTTPSDEGAAPPADAEPDGVEPARPAAPSPSG